MSTRINLLPWREEERKRKNVEFGILAGAAAGVMAILVGLVVLYYSDQISYQNQRNAFLKNEIKVLDSKLETIKELETTKQNLLSRMEIIQRLQGSRPQIVHLFEDLVTTIPEGIWLSSIKQSGDKVTVTGFAESNARVSAYMRNAEESVWIKNPKLVNIESESDGSNAAFTLEFVQESPNDKSDELE